MIALVANHLWQSTLVAGVAALVALACGRSSARVRYWIWLVASMKFLIPFGALVVVGRQLSWRAPAAPRVMPVANVMERWVQPFIDGTGAATATAPTTSALVSAAIASSWLDALALVWIAGAAALVVAWTLRWRRLSRIVRNGSSVPGIREERLLRHVEMATAARQALRFVATDESLEPGVHGVRRPTLLWPRQLGVRLSDAQIEAILAHELSHVRWRDNLTAMLHMLVRAVFWFHPPVLWIGARLLDEREKACDEEVIRLGSDPQVYAEGVIRTCQFCLESPLPCVAGVTGSNLKARIQAIMCGGARRSLSSWQKALLGLAVGLAIGGPMTVGALTARAPGPAGAIVGVSQTSPGAQVESADVFDVVSVKANTSGEAMSRMLAQPGGRVTVTNASLLTVIRNAYRLQSFQVVNAPDWVDRERFDIAAKAEGNPEMPRISQMLQRLLADRFRLRAHSETRELPTYTLVMARADRRLGPQIHASESPCAALRNGPAAAPLPDRPDGRPACGVRFIPGSMRAGGVGIGQLAATLAQQLGRTVADGTGLTGEFDLDLLYTPDQRAGVSLPPSAGIAPPPTDGPSLAAALQEQLGLKLEPSRGPVEVLVIDGVERPTPD